MGKITIFKVIKRLSQYRDSKHFANYSICQLQSWQQRNQNNEKDNSWTGAQQWWLIIVSLCDDVGFSLNLGMPFSSEFLREAIAKWPNCQLFSSQHRLFESVVYIQQTNLKGDLTLLFIDDGVIFNQ